MHILWTNLICVDYLKPTMISNIYLCSSQTSIPTCLAPHQQSLDQVLGLWIKKPLWKAELDFANALKQTDLITGLEIKEWRMPNQHFVNEDSVGPVVDALVVPFGQDNFWRQILGSSTAIQFI